MEKLGKVTELPWFLIILLGKLGFQLYDWVVIWLPRYNHNQPAQFFNKRIKRYEHPLGLTNLLFFLKKNVKWFIQSNETFGIDRFLVFLSKI